MSEKSLFSIPAAERLEDGSIEIRWSPEFSKGVVEIYMGHSPDGIDRTQPVVRVEGKNNWVLEDIPLDRRLYFALKTAALPAIVLGERSIPIEGTFNFRDLGGYISRDGQRVRWGQIYRSDHLGKLTDLGRSQLQNLGIRTVCDLRAEAEVQFTPDALSPTGIRSRNYPVGDQSFDTLDAFRRMEAGDTSWLTPDFMIHAYLRNLEQFGSVWGRIFRRIAEPASRPLVFHCTAGKDRAGTCAALLLLSLGVSEETVIEDYALSNLNLRPIQQVIYPWLRQHGVQPEEVEDYFTAPKKCITAVLDHIQKKYGSPEAYLDRMAGISEQMLMQIREQLLESPA
jgi:protein-tyrosine phosphatase